MMPKTLRSSFVDPGNSSPLARDEQLAAVGNAWLGAHESQPRRNLQGNCPLQRAFLQLLHGVKQEIFNCGKELDVGWAD
jgi:hypothetical protein